MRISLIVTSMIAAVLAEGALLTLSLPEVDGPEALHKVADNLRLGALSTHLTIGKKITGDLAKGEAIVPLIAASTCGCLGSQVVVTHKPVTVGSLTIDSLAELTEADVLAVLQAIVSGAASEAIKVGSIETAAPAAPAAPVA
jgi:hypothetical protein